MASCPDLVGVPDTLDDQRWSRTLLGVYREGGGTLQALQKEGIGDSDGILQPSGTAEARGDAMTTVVSLRGVQIYPGLLSPQMQANLVEDLRACARQAPFFTPVTASGKAMSVRLTSAGQMGWVSDRRGYRYERRHPSGAEWPAIPDIVLGLWRDLVSGERDPDCCLINYYGEGTKMGLHQDRDEADFQWPVLSISLGDEGLFRVGNTTRGGKTESVWLRSGDVLLMGGDARLVYHGVDRIRFGSSRLLPQGGRINLTCRVVT